MTKARKRKPGTASPIGHRFVGDVTHRDVCVVKADNPPWFFCRRSRSEHSRAASPGTAKPRPGEVPHEVYPETAPPDEVEAFEREWQRVEWQGEGTFKIIARHFWRARGEHDRERIAALDELLREAENIVPYVTATLATHMESKPGWVHVHRGRADSGVRQLEGWLARIRAALGKETK